MSQSLNFFSNDGPGLFDVDRFVRTGWCFSLVYFLNILSLPLIYEAYAELPTTVAKEPWLPSQAESITQRSSAARRGRHRNIAFDYLIHLPRPFLYILPRVHGPVDYVDLSSPHGMARPYKPPFSPPSSLEIFPIAFPTSFSSWTWTFWVEIQNLVDSNIARLLPNRSCHCFDLKVYNSSLK